MAEAAAGGASAETPPKKKGKKGLILILVAVVVLLGGGGAGAVVLLKRGATKAEAAGKGAEDGKKEPAKDPGVLSLEPFIANLADADGDRYLKITMRLEIESREEAAKAKADELVITKSRDRILTLLSSKTFAQVGTVEGKEALRDEIRKDVEPLLAGAKVTDVYFTEFIVQ